MAQKKRRRRKRHDTLVLKLLIIVVVVIFVFEGRLIFTMFTQHSSSVATSPSTEGAEAETLSGVTETPITVTTGTAAVYGSALAGISRGLSHGAALSGTGQTTEQSTEQETEPETEAAAHATVSNPDSFAVVREQETAVDDSWFADAVFIGDSRMEGFRNASGITTGTFFTSVGMSLSSMTSAEIISDGDNTMTVAAALSGGSYSKIYIMLGANDLGQYNWETFQEGLISVTKRFLEIQPGATLYLCSCIYVDEDLVTTGDYINNTNVDKLNSIMLEVCEEKGYYYLDLNEVLSDGHGSLIEGASSDGVHLYAEYCQIMLEYLKTHYVAASDTADTAGDSAEEAESETAEDKTAETEL